MLDDLTSAPSDSIPASPPPVIDPPPSPTPAQIKVPPPQGDDQKATDYINKLTSLVKENKLDVFHTDLNKYSFDSIQDHYFLQLSDYEIEISHSKSPDTDKDFYIVLFNNVKQIKEECSEKAILAYIHISADQFNSFKTVADEQIERKRKEAEAKRFIEAMNPIDNLLENLESQSGPAVEEKAEEEKMAIEPPKLENISEPEEKPEKSEDLVAAENPEFPPSATA